MSAFSPNPLSARSDYTGCRLTGSAQGEILYSPPDDEQGWFYHTGVADPSPETTAAIRRIQTQLDKEAAS